MSGVGGVGVERVENVTHTYTRARGVLLHVMVVFHFFKILLFDLGSFTKPRAGGGSKQIFGPTLSFVVPVNIERGGGGGG